MQQSLLLKRSVGLETSAGCLASGSHHPCAPCVQRLSGLGSHHLPSFSSRQSPSCGTCGDRRSPICCSVVMVERQKGCLSPGNWWRQPCCPFWGWPWKSPHSCYHSATAGLAIRDSGGLLGGEPEAHLLVAMQGRGRYKGLL